MSNKPTKRSRQRQKQSYPIPFSALSGNLASMVFADSLYYLLARRGTEIPTTGKHVETSFEELTSLTGLTSRTLRKIIDAGLQQSEPFQLRQNQGFAAHTFTLGFEKFEDQFRGKYARKPQEYVKQNWSWVMAQPYPNASKTSRFPLALLNVFWRKPNGKVVTLNELINRVQKSNSGSPPDQAFIQQALDHLLRLGLIARVDSNSFRFIRDQVARNGHQIWQQQVQSTPSTTQLELLKWGEAQSPSFTQLTQELITLGNFDFDSNFKKIFDALSLVRLETDLPWLKYAVNRHRHRPAGANRWDNCWKLFENTLVANHVRQQSEKVSFDLNTETTHAQILKLTPAEGYTLRWGKIIIWINDKRQQLTGYAHSETIETNLQKEERLVWKRLLTYEDELVRFDLTADMKKDISNIWYKLEIKTSAPIPQLKIEARIEAEFLKPCD